MIHTKSTIVALLLTVILSISLESNSAAPASSQSESTTLSQTQGRSIEPDSIDEEVLELEHLKHPPPQPSGGANTKEEILPQLEKQLEEEAQASASITSSDEDGDDNDDDDDDNDDDNDTGGDSNDGDDEGSSDYAEKLAKASESMLLKTLAEYHNQQRQELQAAQHQHHLPPVGGDSNKLDAADENMKLMKLLPGAARLTFGQRYSSDSTTTTTTSTAAPKTTPRSQPEEIPNNEEDDGSHTNNGHRRGDNAEVLLRHSGGQYSAFDMSQYVFWTGDEAGVARAVEELIQKGLMTRDNAIKFLRDIRLGIDYLQNTYSNHPLKTSEKHWNTESSVAASTTGSTVTEAPTTIATQTETATAGVMTGQPATLAPEILKVIERLPSLLKLNELNEQTDSTQDYDDVVGRLRLADFLYAEYSLEEVIYQLAKVMFTQSLTRGSEPAQHALQKLTEFLESEGNHGRISPVLQKKILDVLLAALADTLAENPELLKAARTALGKHMDKIPQRFSHANH
nr:uncharacterized protein LOC109431507 [Aedes albopictus]XP_029717832.1 uncharacterized protein LOC109431507 [Aedes albopictus]XP_029717833.1 uncharacterized protein LOC109431507 [Aedes albopictus]XP_029717834.1 uncharacterized protein LOC109431507 [Aedes albopictus]XP_029717836.1 uncharacterized protein LOC109431507 [Aedes albopictus]